MYMFVGLLLSLGQQDVSPYMHHHIKQSMGWVVLLVTTIFIDVILFIIGTIVWKGFSVIAGLITIPIILLGILCVKQAREGKYQWNASGAMKFFSGFAGLGSRVLNLFDADHYQAIEQIRTTPPSPTEQVPPQNTLENSQQIPTNISNSEIDLSQYAMHDSSSPLPPSSPEKTE